MTKRNGDSEAQETEILCKEESIYCPICLEYKTATEYDECKTCLGDAIQFMDEADFFNGYPLKFGE